MFTTGKIIRPSKIILSDREGKKKYLIKWLQRNSEGLSSDFRIKPDREGEKKLKKWLMRRSEGLSSDFFHIAMWGPRK